jgi:ankyrin repeat protein
MSVGFGCAEKARLLLQLGASPNAVSDEMSPLQLACARENHRLAKVLLDAGADVNVENGYFNPLIMALRHTADDEADVARTVSLLVERGAHVEPAENGRTPLQWAIKRNLASESTHRIIELLLQEGADPSVRDADGKTPLYAVCHAHHLGRCDDDGAAKVAGMLLEHGAKVEEAGEFASPKFQLMQAVMRDRNGTPSESNNVQ